MLTTLGFFGNMNGMEWIVILAIGLLLFGRRLPEVGKSLGRGIVEFKKGLKGIDDEIEEASSKPSRQEQNVIPPANEDFSSQPGYSGPRSIPAQVGVGPGAPRPVGQQPAAVPMQPPQVRVTRVDVVE